MPSQLSKYKIEIESSVRHRISFLNEFRMQNRAFKTGGFRVITFCFDFGAVICNLNLINRVNLLFAQRRRSCEWSENFAILHLSDLLRNWIQLKTYYNLFCRRYCWVINGIHLMMDCYHAHHWKCQKCEESLCNYTQRTIRPCTACEPHFNHTKWQTSYFRSGKTIHFPCGGDIPISQFAHRTLKASACVDLRTSKL